MKRAVCVGCAKEYPLNQDLTGVAKEYEEEIIVEFGWEYPDEHLDPKRDSMISVVLNQGNLPVLCENCEWVNEMGALPCMS